MLGSGRPARLLYTHPKIVAVSYCAMDAHVLRGVTLALTQTTGHESERWSTYG